MYIVVRFIVRRRDSRTKNVNFPRNLDSRTFLPGFRRGGSNGGERSFSDILVFDVHDVCNARSDRALA